MLWVRVCVFGVCCGAPRATRGVWSGAMMPATEVARELEELQRLRLRQLDMFTKVHTAAVRYATCG